jgi:hypothetical protein
LDPYGKGFDGVEWSSNKKEERVKIEKNALWRMDYWFGVGIPDLYNWKSKSFALHSRSEVTEIQLWYTFENCKLAVASSFNYPAK